MIHPSVHPLSSPKKYLRFVFPFPFILRGLDPARYWMWSFSSCLSSRGNMRWLPRGHQSHRPAWSIMITKPCKDATNLFDFIPRTYTSCFSSIKYNINLPIAAETNQEWRISSTGHFPKFLLSLQPVSHLRWSQSSSVEILSLWQEKEGLFGLFESPIEGAEIKAFFSSAFSVENRRVFSLFLWCQ